MYARNMEHLIIYTAFGFAHDIQLINHLVYTKTPRRLNKVYSPLDFWIGFDQIRWYSHSNPHPYPEFGELPINHHFFPRINNGFSQGLRCFASKKIGGPGNRGSRFKASIEGRLSFDPPQRANSVALGQAGF